MMPAHVAQYESVVNRAPESLSDRVVDHLDQALRTVFGRPNTTGRPNPATGHEEVELSDGDKRLAARLMRVNHTGEVCAQALYHGQSVTARLENVRRDMKRAASEENDHLAWCEHRIEELGSHRSVLNPVFYAGSFAVGAIAGAIGDRWSLGFVAETEDQVVRHLDKHLDQLSNKDEKSRAILERMRSDEARHAGKAREAGGADLPFVVRLLMSATSKVMTKTTYWV